MSTARVDARPAARTSGPRVRDRLAWAWAAAVTALCVTVFEVLSCCGPRARRRQRYCRLVRTWGRLVILGHPARIEGLENIPRDQPLLFASNHQSNFDIPLLHAVLPVDFRWLARHDLFKIPFLGRALRRMDAIVVDRGDRRSAAAALRSTLCALSSRQNVIVFPEGTWGDAEGHLRDFKTGVFSLAKQSGVTVVPLTIIGSNRVNPPFTPFVHRGALEVVVHPPIAGSECAGTDAAEWLQRLRDVIEAPLLESSGSAAAAQDASGS